MVMVSFDPNRPDFAPYGLTCVRWNPTPMRRPDRHNEIELNFLGSGALTYLLGGRKVRVEAHRLCAFWAALPHQIIEYASQTEYFVATIPLAWFLQSELPARLVQPILHGHLLSEPEAAAPGADLGRFAQWEDDLRQGREDLTKAVLLEMSARLLRLAQAQPPLDPARPAGRRRVPALGEGGLNKVEQMACLVAQRYREHLSVGEIGQAVGLHPNYAMSLFQKTFGTTLVEYLTEHRISHAQRLLITTDEKIVSVALNSGFNSVSRFNEAFRRACGCTPRDYRREHRA
ncbi:MAG TPA: helix-turn-helix domain-containing protein [Opitutaceae bacterium]|nr:helix-turn-helix domain-containing protein [Opitutaceae bacterium]